MANPFFGVAKALANRLFPDRNKPSGLTFTFPFKTNNVIQFDYQLQLQPVKLEWITGVFIDNGSNPQPFTLIIGETGQTMTIPANSQANLEVLGLIGDKVSITGATTGAVDVPVTFLNYVPTSANTIWSTLNAGQAIGTITVNGSVTALPTATAFNNGSGTTGGVANTPVQVFAANANRRFLTLYNPYVNAPKANGGIVGVSFGAGLNVGQPGVLEMAPGGSLRFDGLGITSQSVFVSSSDASCVFSAYQI